MHIYDYVPNKSKIIQENIVIEKYSIAPQNIVHS